MVRKKDKSGMVIAAALAVAARGPWEFASLLEIADESGLSVAEIEQIFPRKRDMVERIVYDLDLSVLPQGPDDGAAEDSRDRLFDLLMDRFDAMNQHRAAHMSFIRSFGWNQCDKLRDARLYLLSLVKYLEAAGLDTGGLRGVASVPLYGAAYAWVLYVWMRDASSDLAKTMAALDKMLARMEIVEARLFSRPA